MNTVPTQHGDSPPTRAPSDSEVPSVHHHGISRRDWITGNRNGMREDSQEGQGGVGTAGMLDGDADMDMHLDEEAATALRPAGIEGEARRAGDSEGAGNDADEEPSASNSAEEDDSAPALPLHTSPPRGAMYPHAPSRKRAASREVSPPSSASDISERGTGGAPSIASRRAKARASSHGLPPRARSGSNLNSPHSSSASHHTFPAPHSLSHSHPNRKGKGRAPSEPLHELPPFAATLVGPEDSPFYPSSSADEADLPSIQPKLHRPRRVGALGISISSGSETEPFVSATRVWSDEGREEGAALAGSMSSFEWPERFSGTGTDAGASPANGMVGAREGISDDNYRDIVDDLATENQKLRRKLQHYEPAKVPLDLQKERLFEVRFFEGLPAHKRKEMEDFLQTFVQTLPASASGTPDLAGSSTDRRDSNLSISPTGISPPLDVSPPLETTDSSGSNESIPLAQSAQKTTSRFQNKQSRDRERLAGPSNSGLEPASFSGTGSGMRISPAGGNDSRKRLRTDPNASIDLSPSSDDARHAVEIVDVIERLFEDSLGVKKLAGTPTDSPPSPQGPRTNEAYLGNLLHNDFLSNGWTYLNLICTMAQVHRFSVTLPFIQTALRSFSNKLEVSADGTKVRWVGVARPPLRSSDGSSSHESNSNTGNKASGTASDSTSNSARTSGDSHVNSGVNVNPSTAATSVSHAKRSAIGQRARSGLAQVTNTNVTVAAEPGELKSEAAYFGRQHAALSSPSSTSSQSSIDGTEAIVFYAQGKFCSDLSKDVRRGWVSSDQQGRKVLGLSTSDLERELEEEALIESWEVVEDLVVNDGRGGINNNSFGSQPFDPSSMRISGMTEVLPQDMLTIDVVVGFFPSASYSTPPRPRKRPRVVADVGPLSKRTRYHRISPKILSTSRQQWPPYMTRRIPVMSPNYSTLSEPSESQDSFASGLRAAQREPSKSRAPPAPPLPDYLLSLGLPLYQWAPRETGVLRSWATSKHSGSATGWTQVGTNRQSSASQ